MRASGRSAFVVLGIGVVAASSSSILVRVAQDAGVASLAIAAWRMVFASAVLLPLAALLRRDELRRLGRRDATVAAIAGVFLCGHFLSWISSLQYTTVASSAALVTTNPIWVGLATVFILRERVPRLSIVGIAVSLIGCVLILWADAQAAGAGAGPSPAASAPTLGNGLALLGAVCASAYLLTGRTLAGRLSLLGYLAVLNAIAAVALMGAALVAGVPLGGYVAIGWAALVALAIGPQLIGHSAFNWALRRLSPTFVALAILGEPVGSALLAVVLFREVPGPLQCLAFVILLAGIGIAAIGERPRAVTRPVADPSGGRTPD